MFNDNPRTIEDTKSYCVNIDECFPTGQKCGENATYIDNPGSYSCHCKTGYEQISNDPFQCQDKGKFDIETLQHKITTAHC